MYDKAFARLLDSAKTVDFGPPSRQDHNGCQLGHSTKATLALAMDWVRGMLPARDQRSSPQTITQSKAHGNGVAAWFNGERR